MKKVSAFVANDGEMFLTQDQCKQHEEKLRCQKNALGLATILLQDAPYVDDVQAHVYFKEQDEELLAGVILNNLADIRMFLAIVDNRTSKNIETIKKKKRKPEQPDMGIAINKTNRTNKKSKKLEPVTKSDLKTVKAKRKGK